MYRDRPSDIFSMNFGRADLRIVGSKAKFDGEVDFAVRLAIAPQKPSTHYKKLMCRSENFADLFALTSKNEMLGIV